MNNPNARLAAGRTETTRTSAKQLHVEWALPRPPGPGETFPMARVDIAAASPVSLDEAAGGQTPRYADVFWHGTGDVTMVLPAGPYFREDPVLACPALGLKPLSMGPSMHADAQGRACAHYTRHDVRGPVPPCPDDIILSFDFAAAT